MEQFLRFLITPLLSQPEEFSITISGSSIVLRVSPQDTGRIIGKHGTTIQAIRTLVKTYCQIQNLPAITLVLDSPPLPPKTD